MIEKLNTMKELYRDEMPNQISRWNYPGSISIWEQDVIGYVSTFLQKRPCEEERTVTEYFKLQEFGFSCKPVTSLLDEIMVAPNPTSGRFYLLNNSSNHFLGDMVILDISGKNVQYENYVYIPAGEKKELDIGQLNNGLYIINMVSKEKVGTKKIVLVR